MAKKKTNNTVLIGIIAILVIGMIGITMLMVGFSVDGGSTDLTDKVDNLVALNSCPDTGLTSFKLEVVNDANSTGGEAYDITAYLFKKNADGSLVYYSSVTDTTSATATSIDCNADYVVKAISTSGASGDSSRFLEVQGADAKIVGDDIEFSTTGATAFLSADMEQHASLNCRAYDNIEKANMYDTGDASASDYETDGVTFTSTTDNTTTYSEGNGFDITFECKAVETDTEYNDRGILVLLEMPTTKWGTSPTVMANGVALTEIKSQLDAKEAIAYTDYEFVYLIPSNIVVKDGTEGMSLRVANSLADGITSATADVEVDLAVRGAEYSTNEKGIRVSAVTDASTPVQINTLFDITVDVTA